MIQGLAISQAFFMSPFLFLFITILNVIRSVIRLHILHFFLLL